LDFIIVLEIFLHFSKNFPPNRPLNEQLDPPCCHPNGWLGFSAHPTTYPLSTSGYNLVVYIRLTTPLKFPHISLKIQKKRNEGWRRSEGGEERRGEEKADIMERRGEERRGESRHNGGAKGRGEEKVDIMERRGGEERRKQT
jgi:hypothetical protein